MPKELPIDIIDTQAFKRKFWLKVARIGKTEDECWLWLGALRSRKVSINRRRPCIGVDGFVYYAARISYYLHYKQDPEEQLILHTCDNGLCMNHNHLFLGSYLDNMSDASIKERMNKKLTSEQVVKIKELYSTGIYYQKEIAEMFDITQGMVSMIISNERRFHVEA